MPLPGHKTEKPIPAGKSSADYVTGADINGILDYVQALDVSANADATPAAKGKVQLSGDLAGTAASPQVTGGTITATGSTAARKLKDRFADVLNVKDFGAVGDGATDNAVALAAAAAAANASARPATVYFPAGTYNYSSTPVFTAPVTLRGEPGAWLNYTGTGKAIQLGSTGRTSADLGLYVIRDLTFTGGATMTHGIYVAQFVAYVRIAGVRFHLFGNATAYGIFAQAENWDLDISHNVWTNPSTTKRNWVHVNGVHEDGTTADFGNSRLRFVNNLASNDGTMDGAGVVFNGAHSLIAHNKLDGFNPAVRARSYADLSQIVENYYERGVNGSFIEFGDVAGDPGARLAHVSVGIEASGNYCNMHNQAADYGTGPGFFMAPANAQAGLMLAVVNRNKLSSLAAPTPRVLVSLNDVVGQTGNVASGNLDWYGMQPFPQAQIHATGANISTWAGEDGDVPVPGLWSKPDAAYLLRIRAGTNSPQDTGINFRSHDDTSRATIQVWGAGNIDLLPSVSQAYVTVGAGAFRTQRVTVTYSASMTPDGATGNEFVITATNASVFTINTPSNSAAGTRITVRVRNASGGALGAATWSGYKMAAWTQPANGFSRAIDFQYDGSNWIEVSRTPADVPN